MDTLVLDTKFKGAAVGVGQGILDDIGRSSAAVYANGDGDELNVSLPQLSPATAFESLLGPELHQARSCMRVSEC